MEYKKYVEKKIPKPKYLKNSIWAFTVGGLICVFGEGILDALVYLGMNKSSAANTTSIILIFIGAFLTGIGVYDLLGKRAGAGSIVPITGFSNSIVSPAMEFKREGYVLGVGARMFTLAGPVLVYGIGSSVIVGVVYYFFTMFVK